MLVHVRADGVGGRTLPYNPPASNHQPDSDLMTIMSITAHTRAIVAAFAHFDSGAFLRELSALVAVASESPIPDSAPYLDAYLDIHMRVPLEALGFEVVIYPNPHPGGGPLLIGRRVEDPALPTVLMYGHGDVVPGQGDQWRADLAPWQLTVEGDRVYGRGTADNKGQHWINLCALKAVIDTHGKLGFNCTVLLETMEERGSIGLDEFCQQHRQELRADALVASDGPRLEPGTPTLFLGSRGVCNFRLDINYREGAHHSGNWGGLLKDPGIRLAHAIACIADERGQIKVPAWRPVLPDATVRAMTNACPVVDPNATPAIDLDWGEASLTAPERLVIWNSFAVLALDLADPARPVNAIAPKATAHCQLRFVVGLRGEDILPALQAHLDAQGFSDVRVSASRERVSEATRVDPHHPLVGFIADQVAASTGKTPHIMPNLGGSLPNAVFAEGLGIPTIWLPHSYRSCSQHAPNEHLLLSSVREGLGMMAGVFAALGTPTGHAALRG